MEDQPRNRRLTKVETENGSAKDFCECAVCVSKLAKCQLDCLMVPLRDTTCFKFIHGKVFCGIIQNGGKIITPRACMFSGTLVHWRCHVFHHIAIDDHKSSQGRSAGSEQFHTGHDENVFHQVSK